MADLGFVQTPWILALLCGLLGLLLGSFLNVVVYRLPVMLKRSWALDAGEYLVDEDIQSAIGLDAADRSSVADAVKRVSNRVSALPALNLATPRSRCPHCGHAIAALHNVPVLSFMLLRGRCAGCNTPISIRYPIVEAVTGILFAAAAWHFGWQWSLLDGLVLVAALVSLTLIDADTMLLPDSLTLSLLWLGVLASAAHIGFVSLSDSVIGAAAGYSVLWLLATGFRLLRGVEGMGAGDFKLLAALGAWFGWSALLPIVLMAAGVGAIVGITLMLLKRATMLSRLPFGVYLAPAGIIMLFYGAQLIALVLPGDGY